METWRTKTPRFFSTRTRPAWLSALKASRTGPRDTPSAAATSTSLSLVPAAISPVMMRRSSSCCARVASECSRSISMASEASVGRLLVAVGMASFSSGRSFAAC